MHDSRVFRCSRLGQSIKPGSVVPPLIPCDTFLIGNSGYPSNFNILLPYPLVVDPANKWFNFIQSSTRMVVEQTFGRLKNWFWILLHAQMASLARAKQNKFACMILQNLLNRCGSIYLQDWDERSPRKVQFSELPRIPPASLPTQATSGGTATVSMWTKWDIIRCGNPIFQP